MGVNYSRGDGLSIDRRGARALGFAVDYASVLCYIDRHSERWRSEEFLEGKGIVRELRVNQAIRAPEVLLIGANGERLGVMPVSRALQIAREQDADLVEVAPNAQPPVCRILDYGKFKYEQARREREARKHQRQVETRQVRFRPKISAHDMELKARTTEKLLREGDKVKVSVMFRGREVTYADLGRNLLEQIYEKVKDIAAIERAPSLEGRFMSMVLTPTASKPKVTKEAERKEPAGEQQ